MEPPPPPPPAPRTNPLLSSAVTGLSLQDLTVRAVLPPAPAPPDLERDRLQKTCLGHTATVTNIAPKDNNANRLPPSNINLHPKISTSHVDVQNIDTISKKPTTSKALAKSDDDFDVNEYFARLQSTRYVSAPQDLKRDTNENLEENEHNLEEINLLDDSRPNSSPNDNIQHSLTADIAQNFSQLPQVLPQVASAVFSSFTSILNLNKSREETPVPDSHVREDSYHGNFSPDYGQGNNYAGQEMQPQEVASVPMFAPANVGVAKAAVEERPTAVGAPPLGGSSNTFRMASKKKTYAHIPGLNTSDSHTMPQSVPHEDSNPHQPPIFHQTGNVQSFYSPSDSSNVAEATTTGLPEFNPVQSPFSTMKSSLPAFTGTSNSAVLDSSVNPTLNSFGTAPSSKNSFGPLCSVSTLQAAGMNPSLGIKSSSAVMTELDLTKDLLPHVETKLATLELSSQKDENMFCKDFLDKPERSVDLLASSMFGKSQEVAPVSHCAFMESREVPFMNVVTFTNTPPFLPPSPTSILPPPILPPSTGLPPRNKSLLNRSLLPPSVARKLSNTQSIFKPLGAEPNIPPSNVDATPSEPSYFVPRPPSNISVQSVDSLHLSGASDPKFSASQQMFTPPIIEYTSSSENTHVSKPFAPLTSTTIEPQYQHTSNQQAPSSFFNNVSFGRSNVMPTSNILVEESLKMACEPSIPEPTKQIPPNSVICQPIEVPKPVVPDPPKIPTGQNYRLGNKNKPQYYSGPIEGTGHIGNMLKPTLEPVFPVQNATPNISFFTPTFELDQTVPLSEIQNNTITFDINQPHLPASVPFDISQPHQPASVPFDLSHPQSHPNIYEKQALKTHNYSSVFGISDSSQNLPQEYRIEESKPIALLGSLKSKLSSVNINKLQNAVTSFFDPAYYETAKKDDDTNNINFGQPQSDLQSYLQTQDRVQNYNYGLKQPQVNSDYGEHLSHNLEICVSTDDQQYQNYDQTNEPALQYPTNQYYYPNNSQPNAPHIEANFQSQTQNKGQIQKHQDATDENVNQLSMPVFHENSQSQTYSTGQSQETQSKIFHNPTILNPDVSKNSAWPDSQQHSEKITKNATEYLDQDSHVRFFNPFGQAGDKKDEDQIGQLKWNTGEEKQNNAKQESETGSNDANQEKSQIKNDVQMLGSFANQNPSDFFGMASDSPLKIHNFKLEVSEDEIQNIHCNLQERDQNYDNEGENSTSITSHLIENISAPIQLSNYVNVPLTQSGTDIKTDDSSQFKEISQITEETMQNIQMQHSEDITIRDNESKMFFDDAYGHSWSVKVQKPDLVITTNKIKKDVQPKSQEQHEIMYDKEDTKTSRITDQLIQNVMGPIQLFNPVDVKFTESCADISVDDSTIDPNQFEEISQFTEDTIHNIQIQHTDKREEDITIKDNESKMFFDDAYSYGWSVKPDNINEAIIYQNYTQNPNMSFKDDSMILLRNASDEIKAELIHVSQEDLDKTSNHGYLTREISIPSAPSAADVGVITEAYNINTKEDVNAISVLDINLIEQDAKNYFDDPYVIEQSETDDGKLEREKSEESSEIQSIDFGYDKTASNFDQDINSNACTIGSEVPQELSPVYDDVNNVKTPIVSYASYFDTGNYAADNHFKNNQITSPLSTSAQSSFSSNGHTHGSSFEISKDYGIIGSPNVSNCGDIQGAGDGVTGFINVQEELTVQTTQSHNQDEFVLPPENIIEFSQKEDDTESTLENVVAFEEKVLSMKSSFGPVNFFNTEPQSYGMNSTPMEHVENIEKHTSAGTELFSRCNNPTEESDLPAQKMVKDPSKPTENYELGVQTKVDHNSKLENVFCAQTKSENNSVMPDPMQFFGQHLETPALEESKTEGSFNLLASYFASPPATAQKPDPKRSFFELSEGQDHYMHEAKCEVMGSLKSIYFDTKITDHSTGDNTIHFNNSLIKETFFENNSYDNVPFSKMYLNKSYIPQYFNTDTKQNVNFNINNSKRLDNIFENIADDHKVQIIIPKVETIDNDKAKCKPNTKNCIKKFQPNQNFDTDLNSGAEIEESFTDYESRLAAIINNCDHCSEYNRPGDIECAQSDVESGLINKVIDVGRHLVSDIVEGEAMDSDGKEGKKEEVNLRSNAGPVRKTSRVSITFEDLQEEDYQEQDENNPNKEEMASKLFQNPDASQYRPVRYHWFYRQDREGKSQWRPFSTADSNALEEAYNSPSLNDATVVATDGGRYDVNIVERKRSPVYWTDKPTNVRRCSWFYKGTTDARYVPYTETVADMLEEEFRRGCSTGEWHRRISLPGGESVVLHGATVMVHFLHGSSPDSWGNTPKKLLFNKRVRRGLPPGLAVPVDEVTRIDHLLLVTHGAGEWRKHRPDRRQSVMRPRVVRRGADESEIEEGEPSKVDHLLLLCHGIGSACDLRFRPVEEVVDDFRATSLQLIQSHYRNSYDNGKVGRVEVLPVSWHSSLHSGESGIDKRLATVTLDSIPKLRGFTNDTVLDVLFYTSPVFCQTIMNTVGEELNRIHKLFVQRNPGFVGGVSLGGHSLGSLILFDLMCHQDKANAGKTNESSAHSSDPEGKIKYIVGSAGTGQPYITYPHVEFNPCALYALGSPIAIFECIRGVDSLGEQFSLPTCPAFFNIFHPYDPVAYRIEPLINPELKDLPPLLIPHHKGRKRMHLELKETMARVGADIKQRLVESLRSTWANVWRSSQPPPPEQLEKVIQEQLEKVDDLESSHDSASGSTPDGATPIGVTPMGVAADATATDKRLGRLNAGRRVDHVLQEAPFEIFNEYLFAMTSHVCYWESEDTMLLILREIYGGLGVSPDSVVPQNTMTLEVQRPAPSDHSPSREGRPSTSKS